MKTKLVTLTLLALGFVACGQQEIPYTTEAQSSAPEEGDDDTTPSLFLAGASDVYCPQGSVFVTSSRLCVVTATKRAIGPFPQAMIDKCVKAGGGKACHTASWDAAFAARLRGKGSCPVGSSFDSTLSECVDAKFAYGPFTKDAFAHCQKIGGGQACESMRWSKSVLAAKSSEGSFNRKLAVFYSNQSNYNKVYDDVMNWYGTKTNACVAFMSTAIRMAGLDIPKYGYYKGERISLVTLPFAGYLEDKLKWKRIEKADDLKSGDVVMTEDDRNWPGYPAHTYMFYSWSNKAKSIGNVIDNQGFIHERNIFGYGDYNFTPFAYALRSVD